MVRFSIVDEEGKRKRKERSIAATRLYKHGRVHPVVGDALVVDSPLEMNGWIGRVVQVTGPDTEYTVTHTGEQSI